MRRHSDKIKENENGKPGQLFEDFLREQGAYEQTTEHAIKRVIAFQLAEAMKENGISKVAMAKRLLDPPATAM